MNMGLTVDRSQYTEKQISSDYTSKSTSWFSKACTVLTKTCAAGAKACTTVVNSTVVKACVVAAIVFVALASPAGVTAQEQSCRTLCSNLDYASNLKLHFKTGKRLTENTNDPESFHNQGGLPRGPWVDCSIDDFAAGTSYALYDNQGNFRGHLSSNRYDWYSIAHLQGPFGDNNHGLGLNVNQFLNSGLCACVPQSCN
jgi:hypothetical protein